MSLRLLFQLGEFFWNLESRAAQRLAWKDAEQARTARARAEALAAAQLEAMLIANPSGSLGHAQLDDREKLERSGLL